MSDPLKYYDNNLCGTTCLLQSMVAHGVDKIVFSSTAATYGEPERIPILESDKTVPTNRYCETKLAMEKMMRWTSQATTCTPSSPPPGPGTKTTPTGIRGE